MIDLTQEAKKVKKTLSWPGGEPRIIGKKFDIHYWSIMRGSIFAPPNTTCSLCQPPPVFPDSLYTAWNADARRSK